MTISELVSAALQSGMSELTLADALKVSPDTIARWKGGRTLPRPAAEGQLRRLIKTLGIEETLLPAGPGDQAEANLDAALRKLREALYRRGRLSSRNEALDEVAKLIFAHAAALRLGKPGVDKSLLIGSRQPAAALRKLVSDMIAHLPESLSYEMSIDDFTLKIKDAEDELASEIIGAFEHLTGTASNVDGLGDGSADLINHAFGRFLADSFTDEKELGQYLTPPEVVQFMVRLALADMSEGEQNMLRDADNFTDFGLVLDPSCGVGSFLAEFVRTTHRVLNPSSDQWLERAARELVIGIDKSERMVRLALANLATFGSPAVNLHLANALAREGHDATVTEQCTERVGLILTNPPFGASFDRSELGEYQLATSWARRPPSKIPSELLFMERYMDWLKPGGQLLAIVPDSILTNKGLFADLREGLAQGVDLRTVVSLPPVTFATAGTSTKTSILHLRKRRDAKTATRFAICNNIGYSVSARGSQRRKVQESTGELPIILADLVSGARNVVHEVSYVDEKGRWDAAYHASLTGDFLRRVSKEATLAKVSDVADLVAIRADPRRFDADEFRYVEISDISGDDLNVSSKTISSNDAPSRARRSISSGDVLVSTVRPDRGNVGVVPAALDGAVCTTGLAVLRPKNVHPLVLARLLRSEFVIKQLLRNNVGIAYPAIEPSCLPEISLPVALSDLASMTVEAEAYASAKDALALAKANFSSKMEEIEKVD